jgi:hypothetical protein
VIFRWRGFSLLLLRDIVFHLNVDGGRIVVLSLYRTRRLSLKIGRVNSAQTSFEGTGANSKQALGTSSRI